MRDLEKHGRWASEKVEISADQVDRTRAVTTRLTKCDLTNRKSVRERLRKIWQVGFSEGRNFGRPSRSDTGRHDTTCLTKCNPTKGKSVRKRLRKIWQMGFREDRNVSGPS